ncbi:MAG: hypothetical protein M5U09_13700 [Gammaproteobacteria bacterium]|nr:hypothetical protein [Gammaproteobacteria bacterium]
MFRLYGATGNVVTAGTLAATGGTTATGGLEVPAVGVDLEDDVPVILDTADAVTLVYDSVGTEVDLHGADVDLDQALDVAGLVTAAVGLAVTTVGVDLEDDVPVILDTADAVTLVYDSVGTEVDLHGADVDLDQALDVAGLVTAAVGLAVPTVGVDLEDDVPVILDTADAVTLVYDSVGTEVDLHGADVDLDQALDVAGLVTAAVGLAVPTVGVDLEDDVPVMFDTADVVTLVYDSLDGRLECSTEYWVDGALTATGPATATDLTLTAPVAPTAAGHRPSLWAAGFVDCATTTCSQAASPISMGGTMPDNALVLGCVYQVTVTLHDPTDTEDDATVALLVGTTDLKAATAINDVSNPWDATDVMVESAVPLDRSAPINLLTAATPISLAVVGDTLDAGAVWALCEWVPAFEGAGP